MTMNTCYVKAVIEEEGLGYAIVNYMGPENVLDPHLKKLWIDAERVLTAIERYIAPYDAGADWDAQDWQEFIERD